MSFSHDLQSLRAAAHQRSANDTQFMLKKLFQQMEFVIALGVAAEQAHAYVDTFERYHPEEIWARRMLVQIVMTASAPDESIIQQAFQHFTTPGTANFFKALYDLYQGTQEKHASSARIGFLVSACVNAMTAELVELYFGTRPDAWEAYRAQGAHFQQIALDFWTDEAIVARDVSLWLQLADKIEAASKRYGDQSPKS